MNVFNRAKRLEFHNFDGTITPLREELDIGTPGILSTESKTMPVRIETTMGYIILDFESIRFTMDTGKEVEYETIKKTGEEYWTEWKTKTDSSGSAR